MKQRKYKILVGDFETTVYSGQEHTEVWASGLVELYTENTVILHSIEDTLQHLVDLDENLIVYYHNLKFDGNFWLAYFLLKCGFKQAVVPEHNERNELTYKWLSEKDMPCWSFKYSISDRGQWYSITLKTNRHIIEFRDSYKLLPFSLETIGESFGTKHKKLHMEYTGFRYAGCPITPEEESYLKNDLLVIKEALEITFSEGHTKLTIGSCCLEEFKKDGVIYGYRRAFELLFDKTGYYAYVNEKSLRTSVNKFLDEIENSTYDHDLPSLISYFENVDVEDVGEASGENAILLTTIHKTKGLEYPVVILIGAGKSLKKQERHGEIAMDENFGIAVKRYEEGQEEKTVKLLAIRYLDEQKRFQEEMMIFYVALTRAKNRLYIIGEYKNPYSIKFDCYFDYIFASLCPNELESLLKEESLVKGAVSYHIITEVEDSQLVCTIDFYIDKLAN